MAKKPKPEPVRRRRFRLLPLTVTMLSLLLVIKVNDLYLNSRQLREFYGVRDAAAEEKAAAETAAKKEEAKPAEAASAPAKTDGTPEEHKQPDTEAAAPEAKHESGHGEGEAKPPAEEKTFGTGKRTVKEIEALKQKEMAPAFSQTEIDLLQNLGKRREELDQRERDIELKAKVLDAGEKRLDDKMTQMRVMQTELSKVVAQYNEKQSTQIKSLVKIYENMKPTDAANIFNQMDMPILLEVIDKMSERKVSPVLAAMDPKKAKDVTEELAAMRHAGAAAEQAAGR